MYNENMFSSRPKRVIYTGIFFNRDEFFDLFSPKLVKGIEYPHVTISFKPKGSEVHQELFGTKVEVQVVGYAISENNEGVAVKCVVNNTTMQKLCDELALPHITISVSETGKPVDTVNLDFKPVENGAKLTGRFGAFTTGGIVY